MAKKWMQKAFAGSRGQLRAKAKRRGLVSGEESMSKSDLDRLEAAARRRKDTKTLRQVNLARRGMEARKG